MADENGNNQVAVVSNSFGEINPNQALEQGEAIFRAMDALGIKEATFDRGMYYRNDNEDNVKTLASDGVMLIKKQHTTQLIFRNKGSTPEQTVAEIEDLTTQKAAGGFTGKYQQWISEQLTDQKNNS